MNLISSRLQIYESKPSVKNRYNLKNQKLTLITFRCKMCKIL